MPLLSANLIISAVILGQSLHCMYCKDELAILMNSAIAELEMSEKER
jgi:hypothetical protein